MALQIIRRTRCAFAASHARQSCLGGVAVIAFAAGCHHDGISNAGLSSVRPGELDPAYSLTDANVAATLVPALKGALLEPGEARGLVATLRINPTSPPTTFGNAEDTVELSLNFMAGQADDFDKAGDAVRAAAIRKQITMVNALRCTPGHGKMCLDLSSLGVRSSGASTKPFGLGDGVDLSDLGGINVCALQRPNASGTLVPVVDCPSIFKSLDAYTVDVFDLNSEIDVDIYVDPNATIDTIGSTGKTGLRVPISMVPHLANTESLNVDKTCDCLAETSYLCQQHGGALMRSPCLRGTDGELRRPADRVPVVTRAAA